MKSRKNGTDEPTCLQGRNEESDTENERVEQWWRERLGQVEKAAHTYIHYGV